MTPETARELGQDALLWLVAQPERFGGFLASAGLGHDDVRARSKDPEFLGFVLEFLLSSDEMVLAMSEETGRAPESVAEAHAALLGRAPDWT